MSRRIGRRELLWGAGGGGLGLLAYHNYAATIPAPPGSPQQQGKVSYAQSGEDLIAGYLLQMIRVRDVTYLDIGAYKPIALNNTYLFYKQGLRGVLVEPNVDLAGALRSVRPHDTTLVAGIGLTAEEEADYYLMSDPAWNTFSKEEAEHMEEGSGGRVTIRNVVKMPLLNVNDVMAEHFGEAPTFVSIDAEGLHLPILKAIDYDRYRPALICIETLVSGTPHTIPEIPAFMESRGYVLRGMTFTNSLFLDGELLARVT